MGPLSPSLNRAKRICSKGTDTFELFIERLRNLFRHTGLNNTAEEMWKNTSRLFWLIISAKSKSKNQRKRLKARCRVVAREQRAGSVTQQIFTLGYLAHFLESKLEQEILLHMFDKCWHGKSVSDSLITIKAFSLCMKCLMGTLTEGVQNKSTICVSSNIYLNSHVQLSVHCILKLPFPTY